MRASLASHGPQILPIDMHDPSLVLYLPLWYPAPDISGAASLLSYDKYRHTGTVTGAVWTPQGRYFDGTDDYIDCGRHTSLDMGTGDFTLIAWVNPASVLPQEAAIISKGSAGGGGKRYVMYVSDASGVVLAGLDDDAAYTIAQGGTDIRGGWHHVAFSASRSGNGTIYIDGMVDTSANNPKDITPSALTIDDVAKDLCIGIASWDEVSYQFKGYIGEAYVINRALTAGEVAINYDATKWRYK